MSQENSPKTYKCLLCHDSGYVFFEQNGYSYVRSCGCFYDTLVEHNFGSHYRGKTLDNYEGRSPSMAKAKEILGNNLKDSFFITGDVGLGKTHLMAGLFYKMLMEGRRSSEILVMTELELLGKLVEKDADLEMIERSKTIFLDDMGKIVLNKWQMEKFFAFYNDIYRHERQLIISSNYSIADISDGEMYGGAIGRRIEERARILEIKLPELLDS